MTYLHIDLEVYSPLSIKEHPLDVYAGHPNVKILMCAYAFNDQPVKVWECDGGPCPELREGLRDPAVMKVAWNIGYERTVLAAKGIKIPLEQFTDVMALARYAGLPGRLKDCASVPMIGVPPEAKTKAETALIRKFCMPGKDGVSAKSKTDSPEDWKLFVDYCRRDVETMRHIMNWLLPRFPFPPREREIWLLDQKINERGLPVDTELARAGMRETDRLVTEANRKLKEVTGLDNPNSVAQILPWAQALGYEFSSLGKDFVRQSLAGV